MSFECEIVERSAQPTLAVRTRTSVAELSGVMGQVYGSIVQYRSELGEFPAGAPYAAYFNMDMEDMDVEIGIPVARALPAKGDTEPGELPGGKAASCIHVGPYDQLEPAYAALSAFVAERGYQATGVAYEFYLNDPGEVSPTDLETQILFPLR